MKTLYFDIHKNLYHIPTTIVIWRIACQIHDNIKNKIIEKIMIYETTKL